MVPQQAEAYREAVAQLRSNVASNASSQPGACWAPQSSGAAHACAPQHDAQGCGDTLALRSRCQRHSECNRDQRVWIRMPGFDGFGAALTQRWLSGSGPCCSCQSPCSAFVSCIIRQAGRQNLTPGISEGAAQAQTATMHAGSRAKGSALGGLAASKISNIFVHLRKIALHPLLIRRQYNEGRVDAMARLATSKYGVSLCGLCYCSASVFRFCSCLRSSSLRKYQSVIIDSDLSHVNAVGHQCCLILSSMPLQDGATQATSICHRPYLTRVRLRLQADLRRGQLGQGQRGAGRLQRPQAARVCMPAWLCLAAVPPA